MDVGETVKAHTAPAWLTVMAAVPTETIAVRAALVGFWAAETPNLPLPGPGVTT
jgi:hypothetical protein